MPPYIIQRDEPEVLGERGSAADDSDIAWFEESEFIPPPRDHHAQLDALRTKLRRRKLHHLRPEFLGYDFPEFVCDVFAIASRHGVVVAQEFETIRVTWRAGRDGQEVGIHAQSEFVGVEDDGSGRRAWVEVS